MSCKQHSHQSKVSLAISILYGLTLVLILGLVIYFTPALSASSPYLFMDIEPGPGSSYPSNLVKLHDELFFDAGDSINGFELWGTDGTPAGTALLDDLLSGTASSYPSYLTTISNTLYFAAYAEDGYQWLWRSDGTLAGTTKIEGARTICEISMTCPGLASVRNIFFFYGGDQEHGYELWKSDGTATGTSLVKDIRPGPDSSYIVQLTRLGDEVYFIADDDLHGFELWKSDGTPDGTSLVKDINPGYNPALEDLKLATIGNQLFFAANDGVNGSELWVTRGNPLSTVMVKDIYPGQNGSRPDYLTNYDGELFFYADDGSHGRELWKSDGTLDGTTLVKDIRPGDKGKHSLGSPYHLGPIYHGYLYFEANTDDALQLWRTDGTSAGTTYVMDLAPETDSISYSLGEVIHLNNLLYIHRYVADQYGVWASDDAGSSTLIATDLTPYWSMDQTDPNNFIGNQYLFQGYTSNNGYELWAIPVTTLSALNLSLVSKNTIDSGSLITYTISFSNTGATTASNVILTDTLSTKITPLHFDTSGVNMTLIGESPYCWAISDLSPGDKGTIVITAIPNAGLHVGELITNTAQISASMSDGIAWKSRRAKQAVIVFAYRNYIPMILR